MPSRAFRQYVLLYAALTLLFLSVYIGFQYIQERKTSILLQRELTAVRLRFANQQDKEEREVWQPVQRDLEVPVLIYSFPKSGRTWLRFMLSEILAHHFQINVTLHEILDVEGLHARLPEKVPLIQFSHGDSPELTRSQQHYHPFKLTVEQVQLKKEWLENVLRRFNVVFLVRDPRDSVVSAYYERRLREKRKSTKIYSDINEFVKEQRGSYATILALYNLWYHEARYWPRQSILMRYEDLQQHTLRELKRLMQFLRLSDVSDATLERAIELGRFENMRRAEEQNLFNIKQLRPKNFSNPNSFKVREGKIGGYVDHVSVETATFLTEKLLQELPHIFGYM